MKGESKKLRKKQKVKQYTHKNTKRSNNPPVGLVTPGTDPDQPKKRYSYDPRQDPRLQWSGKQENIEFDVDTVSLHVHERIDPYTILEKVMKSKQVTQETLFHYFETPENNPPLRNAIEFYQHDQNWSNRLIAGDSLLVMNSLLEKERMEGKVQMIYIDPPYGIKYGSNFQPFVNKRDVKDGKDEDLTQEPETIKAFRDTWELGIHSYLSYLRDRLILSHKLLHESGSIFVQISDENIHLVRNLMDETFGMKNFVSLIAFQKTAGSGKNTLDNIADYIIWYAKDIKKIKYRQLYSKKNLKDRSTYLYNQGEFPNGLRKKLTEDEIKNVMKGKLNCKLYRTTHVRSEGKSSNDNEFEFDGRKFQPGSNHHWKTSLESMKTLAKKNRLIVDGRKLGYIRYLDDFPYTAITNLWSGFGGAANKIYVVQTNPNIIQRCMLMCTDPGSLVLDPTCGGGTTAFVAEQWGRRWITCDSSRIAIALTKQRLMTAKFNFYQLNNAKEGISSGFEYKLAPHITLSSIAHNEPPSNEILYDQPIIQNNKKRISGPFTVEAVPAPIAKSLDVLSEEHLQSRQTTIQSQAISHQEQWRDELLNTGIRGREGQKIEFVRVESHPATRWLHADAKTNENSPKRVMISFGPEHAPLEQRQVELAIEEAHSLVPKPKMIIFAAMQFDPEAAKDIDELNWPGATILKVEMNKDLLTQDLKKKRSSNESFWLMGQPDIELQKTKNGKHIITVNGFDYYDTRTGEVDSGSSSKIAMWMLDEDYDGRSVYPQQIFFPMEGKTGGWNKLAKTLQAQIDEELITKYQGTQSIPFKAGPNKRAAVKIIDDRGIESLKIIKLE